MMGNHWVWGLHLIFLSFFLVATTFTCLAAQNSTVGCHERGRLALLKFKNSVIDESNMLSSWVGLDCCSWKGVRCDGATGSIVSLLLRGKESVNIEYLSLDNPSIEFYIQEEAFLIGDKVKSYLAELRHLKHLDLSRNYFGGSRIPEFIGSFKQLSYLNLSNAGFSGIIPHHIGNLSNLKVLDLSCSSYMSCDIISNDMAWVSGLSSLKHLDLSEVNFSQAKNIAMVLTTIPSLTYLSLRACGLSNAYIGLHVKSSKILPNIKHLDLSFNNFEGQLPLFFQNMTYLTFLDLSSYNLSLSWNSLKLLNMIPSLSELHLSKCGLHTVPFSPSYFNSSAHSNIQYLDLSNNWIEGSFPSELTNMSSLRVLDLSGNSLNSSIPVMPNLQRLDISYNNFEQIEHVAIWRQCYLKELIISGNYLMEGKMIGPYTNTSECSQYALEMLDSYANGLTGSIPESIERLTSLRVLNLGFNELTGSIPKALERLRSLEVLNLGDNKLTGPIPTFLGKLSILYLSRNQFSGSIPESLGRLRGLTELVLFSNHLTGPIPASLGRLASLQIFLVNSNLLNGTLPVSVGQLKKLILLDVSNNSLEGVVLETHFAKLSMLKTLDTTSNLKLIINISHEWVPPFQLRGVWLGSCKITHGFPQWLQTQKMLLDLVLSNASLYGPLPTWLQKMPYICRLDLSHNKLSGSLINLPFSEDTAHLLLRDNLFNGSIPRSLCRKTLLRMFDVSMNRLSGNIPQDLGNLRSLSVLDLGNNEFSGKIPNWIGKNLTDLAVLRLRKNNFTGKIPQSLCKCSNLQILDVAHNNLTGSIPPCFGELSKMLVMLILSSNGLSGVLPSSLGNFYSELVWLKLNDNNFNGELPRDLGNLRYLDVLDLGNNRFSGNIPKWIGKKLTDLVVLRLHRNNFTGKIPQSLCKCSNLHILDVAHNNLTGSIPPCLGELSRMIKEGQQDSLGTIGFGKDVTQVIKGVQLEYTNVLLAVPNMEPSSNNLSSTDVSQVIKGVQLEYTNTLYLVINMDLSSNKLTGEIPPAITALTLLVGLNLSHNNLKGSIPDSIGNMKALISLDFSDNQFTGRIPPSMAALNFLSCLNLSHNNLSGRIPTGNQLQTLTDPSIYAGNRDLCGAPLPNNCSNHGNPPTTNKNKYEDVDQTKNLWFYVDIYCGFATGFWGIIGVLSFKKEWKQKLFMIAEVPMDKVYVAVAVSVSKIKRGREAQ